MEKEIGDLNNTAAEVFDFPYRVKQLIVTDREKPEIHVFLFRRYS